MSSFAVGQPFNNGPVWERMRFDSNLTQQTPPLAGSLMSTIEQITSSPSWQTLGSDEKTALLFGTLLDSRAAESAKANQAMFDKAIAYQERASERANEMGIRNQVIGSFLKDVPAAISNAFAQRQRYKPEQIQIAANAAQRGAPGYSIPNYYGFVG